MHFVQQSTVSANSAESPKAEHIMCDVAVVQQSRQMKVYDVPTNKLSKKVKPKILHMIHRVCPEAKMMGSFGNFSEPDGLPNSQSQNQKRARKSP